MYYEKPTRTPEVVAQKIEFEDTSEEAGEDKDTEAGEENTSESDDEAKAEEEEAFEEAQEIPATATVAASTTTRSGRAVCLPKQFCDDEVGLIAATQSHNKICLTAAEEKYYDAMRDLNELGMSSEHCLVRAGLGGGFKNTAELMS